MNDLTNAKKRLRELLNTNDIERVIISSPIKKSDDLAYKIDICKIEVKKRTCFQFSYYKKTSVKHENIFEDELDIIEKIFLIMSDNFKQCNIFSDKEITLLMNKKRMFKITGLKDNMNCGKYNIKSHNKEKNYILKDGEKIDWLIKLGIMSKDGFVLNSKQKKFRQINRFLEMIDDVSKYLPENSLIIDMGCGKSYLTFAMYYYLNLVKNKNVYIKGFDLKKDVVEYCGRLAFDFNFKNLEFSFGDISDIEKLIEKADMVVALHACDTATDYALYNAVKWKSKVILSVPCCQHEVFKQVENDLLKNMFSHGVLKERFSSLLTDSVRAETLELCGYSVSVMEFIDMEHTPKNIMIRAIKKEVTGDLRCKLETYENLLKQFNINPTIYKLLKDSFLC